MLRFGGQFLQHAKDGGVVQVHHHSSRNYKIKVIDKRRISDNIHNTKRPSATCVRMAMMLDQSWNDVKASVFYVVSSFEETTHPHHITAWYIK